MKYLPCDQIARPSSHVSETLPFAKIKLGPLKRFLCALAVSDVLNRTEHLVGPSRCISLHVALTVHGAHFTVGTNDSMFCVGAHCAQKGLFCRLEDTLSIFRVDHFANCR